MEHGFDHKQYRKNLLEKVLDEKVKADGKIKDAQERYGERREEYHRARLLQHGNYEEREDGILVEKQSGYTPAELAATERLYNSMEYSFEQALHTLESLSIPESALQSARMREAARKLFWEEATYGEGFTVERAPIILKLASLFQLEDLVKERVTSNFEYAVFNKREDEAQAIIQAYPFFHQDEIEREERRIRERRLAEYYPVEEGLRGILKPEDLFGDLVKNSETEPTVSLEKVAEVLREKASLLANDLKSSRYIYRDLQAQFYKNESYGGIPSRVSTRVGFRRDDSFGYKRTEKRESSFDPVKKEKSHPYVRVIVNLSGPSGSDSALEFHFSCDREVRNKSFEKNTGFFSFYMSPNYFRFEGIYAGERKYDGEKNEGLIRIDETDADLSSLRYLQVSKQALLHFSELLLDPEKDFSVSLRKFEDLAKKWNIPEEEIEDMKKAIQEFGTHRYHERKNLSSHVGDCLIIPNTFNGFCRVKFELNLDTARYGKYLGGGSDMGYESCTFYHEVSVFGGRIVIDWTARQYAHSRDVPFPYVYEIGDEKHNLGILHKMSGYKTDLLNEPFLDEEINPKDLKQPERVDN